MRFSVCHTFNLVRHSLISWSTSFFGRTLFFRCFLSALSFSEVITCMVYSFLKVLHALQDGTTPPTVVQRSDCPFLKPSNLPENVLHIPLPPLSGSFSSHFSFQYLFVCRRTFMYRPYQKRGYRLDTYSEGRKEECKKCFTIEGIRPKRRSLFGCSYVLSDSFGVRGWLNSKD